MLTRTSKPPSSMDFEGEGLPCISAVELGYSGKSDKFHLEKAGDLNAIVLTHDVDFLIMASSPSVNHRGIIFSHAKNVSIGGCIRSIELILNVTTDKDMRNHIEFL